MLELNNLRNETAVANQSEVMEADTISKNGRSSKSHMSRGNRLQFVLALFWLVSLGLSGCSQVSAQGGGSGGKIPDGTYVHVWSQDTNITFTFSGKKVTVKDGTGRIGSGEFTYTIKDDIIIRYDENSARNLKYVLDGTKLIIYEVTSGGGVEYYSSRGMVFTKQ